MESSRHVSTGVVVAVAVATGILAGVGAHLLKWLIARISVLFTSGLYVGGANWLLLVGPLAGIMLTGIYTRYVVGSGIEHGVERMQANIALRRYRLPAYLVYAPLAASAVTLGFGGSAGSEGPIAYAGGAIGSNLATRLHMPPHVVMMMIGCGAGAGIAGIFKAPIGGALFTVEVLGMTMTSLSVIAVVAASVAAAMTAYVLSGNLLDMAFTGGSVHPLAIMPWVVLLGVFCGIYSVYYSATLRVVRYKVECIRNPWIMNLVSGGVLAVMVFLFPALYGEGYAVIGAVIDGNYTSLTDFGLLQASSDNNVTGLVAVVVGMLLCKGAAASLTNSGGGVAGDFAPTLFAGCLAGWLFATCADTLWGIGLPERDFAFIGMAGVMSGAIGAPLMAMFLTAEMSGNYSMLLPLAVVSVVSWLTVRGLASAR
ncbi:MAG: chloride channel protein [Muribaculaceae bacterium]|nr:chloride channel protein [Muribaculaceae bacterium]